MNRELRARLLLAPLLALLGACGGSGSAASSSGCFWRIEVSGDVQMQAGREGQGFPGAYGFFEDDGETVLSLSSLSQAALVGFWLDLHLERAPEAGTTGSFPLGAVDFRLMEGVNPARERYRMAAGGDPAQLLVQQRSDHWLAAAFTVPLVREGAQDAGPHALIEGAFRTPLGKTRCPR